MPFPGRSIERVLRDLATPSNEFIKPLFFHFIDFSIVLRFRAYKTNVFFTFSILVLFYDYGPIKPIVFHFFDFSIVLRLRVYKTNGFSMKRILHKVLIPNEALKGPRPK